MKEETLNAIKGWIGFCILALLWGLLIYVILSTTGCAKPRVITYKNDPIEYELTKLQSQEFNFFGRGLEIAKLRDEFGRSTKLYVGWCGRTGWRVLWQDWRGHIRDSLTDNTSHAQPMFSFRYLTGMKASANTIYLKDKLFIRVELWEDLARYRITKGREYIRILRASK